MIVLYLLCVSLFTDNFLYRYQQLELPLLVSLLLSVLSVDPHSVVFHFFFNVDHPFFFHISFLLQSWWNKPSADVKLDTSPKSSRRLSNRPLWNRPLPTRPLPPPP